MPDTFVVHQPADDTYLKNFIGEEADPQPIFGPLEEAWEYDTQDEVDKIAEKINAGTVGLPRPR